MMLSIHPDNIASVDYTSWIEYMDTNDILTIRNYDDFQDVAYYKILAPPTLNGSGHYTIDISFIAEGSQSSYTVQDRYMIGYVKSGPTGVQGK